MRKKEQIRILDTAIWLFTIVFFAAIYIYDTNPLVSLILLGLTMAIVFLSLLQNKFKMYFKYNIFYIFVLVFAGYCLFSAIWAKDAFLSIEKGITILEILICMVLINTYYSRLNSVEKLLQVIMYGGFAVGVYCIFNLKISNAIKLMVQGERMDSTFANANSIGMVAAVSLVLAFYYFLCEKNRRMLIIIIFDIVIVAISGSRKAMVMVAIGFIWILLMNTKEKSRLKTCVKLTFSICIIVIAIKVILSLQLFAGINERMQGLIALVTGNGIVDSSSLKRQDLIITGLNQFKRTPILGIGIGNAKFINNMMGYEYLHNNYVELLACGGIVGFMVYYSMYIYVLIKLWRKRKNKLFKLILLLAVLMLVADYGSVNYYSKSTYFYLMIIFNYLSNLSKND